MSYYGLDSGNSSSDNNSNRDRDYDIVDPYI